MTGRLTTKQREELYDAEVEKSRAAGLGDFPICRLCNFPILPGRAWHVNHEAHKPHWLGGDIDGISHKRCNERNNHTYATPLFAKSNRTRLKHLDIVRSSSRPLPGSFDSGISKPFRGPPIDRRTRMPWRPRQ